MPLNSPQDIEKAISAWGYLERWYSGEREREAEKRIDGLESLRHLLTWDAFPKVDPHILWRRQLRGEPPEGRGGLPETAEGISEYYRSAVERHLRDHSDVATEQQVWALVDDALYERACHEDWLTWYEAYVSAMPAGRHRDQVLGSISRIKTCPAQALASPTDRESLWRDGGGVEFSETGGQTGYRLTSVYANYYKGSDGHTWREVGYPSHDIDIRVPAGGKTRDRMGWVGVGLDTRDVTWVAVSVSYSGTDAGGRAVSLTCKVPLVP